MTDVSLALAQMIGQEEQGLAKVSDDRLLLKTQLCRKIADLLEILAPGILFMRFIINIILLHHNGISLRLMHFDLDCGVPGILEGRSKLLLFSIALSQISLLLQE